jgi:DNA-binding NarL/FixJ family response regulator
MPMTERVIVADDHPIFREGVTRLLGSAFAHAEIVEAGSVPEMLDAARSGAPPELFMLDLIFPGMDAQTTLPMLRAEFPRASLVVVSMVDDESTIRQIMDWGADGFIGKAVPSEGMLAAISGIRAGQFVVMASTKGGVRPRGIELTPRQRDVLELLAEGKSNKEIGRSLAISPFTVRIHVSALLRLLNVETRTGVAAKARALGI